jgi:hypothetical protein
MKRERIPDSLLRKLASLIHADHISEDEDEDEEDEDATDALECGDGETVNAILDAIYDAGFIVSKVKTLPKRVYTRDG